MGNLTVKESGEMINFISPNVSKITSFKIHFSPRQEGTGDPSPENVREITGWNGVEGYGCGKNLFNGIMRKGSYNTTTGEFENTNWYTSELLPVKPNTTYAFVKDGELNYPPYSYQFDEQKQYISNTYTTSSKIITTRNETKYIVITISANAFNKKYLDNFMICEGNNINAIRDITASTDWTEDVGTIYGGYVDLVNGELVEEEKLWIKNTSEMNSTNSNFAGWRNSGIKSIIGETNESFYSQILNIGNYYTVNTTDNYDNLYLPNSTYNLTQDEWKEKAIDVKIVAPLATPITHQLTPQQLSTLKGQNNFWSNADYVEIEYELTETFDIQKAKRKIILNQPHVETVSGTIAKPETDMIGKIKECKIHFMPVQQSDSDPTPDNIVPVTGWTGIDVYQAFVEYPITPIVNTTEGYGVKWVVDKDGLMTAYGTPTAFTGANLGTIDVNGDETLYGIVGGSLNNVTFNKPTLLDSNNHSINYSAGDGILITGLDLSLYNDVKRIRVSLKRSGNVFMSGSCNAIVWKNKKPTISTTTIDWTDVAGTMYGGYVDLISGELVQEFKQCKINELSWIYESNGKCFMSGKNTPNDILKDKSLLGSYVRSNYYTPIDGYGSASTYANKQDYSISLYAPSDQYRIAIKDSRFTDVSSFLSAMGDTYIWYRLAEPTVTYQLTPQQLTTLRGINNIWSSANGEVEIKYWKH